MAGQVSLTEGQEINLELMLNTCRALGLAQWGALGASASNDRAAWVGAIDRAAEWVRSKNFKLALTNLRIAEAIESDWPRFNGVAERVSTMITGWLEEPVK